MSDSLALINAIRDVASQEYQTRIPEATRENIKAVGNTILSYEPTANAFFTSLVNRIGKVVVDKMDASEDIYAIFKTDRLEYGDTIQKIFIDVTDAQAFDDNEGITKVDMLKKKKGAIHVEYTKVDRKIFYKTTISVAQLKEAFTSVKSLDQFVMALIESMKTSLELDKYIMLTNTLYTHANYVANTDGLRVLRVPETVARYNNTTKMIEWGTVGAKDFLKLVRVLSRGLKFYHKLPYGENGNVTGTIQAVTTPVSKQVLALEVSTWAEIDINALAVIFNLAPAQLQTRSIELEDGALGQELDTEGESKGTGYIGGFVCNIDAIERGVSYEDNDSFKNPEGLYVNFWKHYWGYEAVSKFKDFVPIIFSTYTPEGE